MGPILQSVTGSFGLRESVAVHPCGQARKEPPLLALAQDACVGSVAALGKAPHYSHSTCPTASSSSMKQPVGAWGTNVAAVFSRVP